MSDGTDIGALLRRERESHGWTVRDVSHRTRIPGPTVEALECNDYSSFPGAAYAKSFLTQYCEFLEVDADEWLDAFDTGNSLANLDEYEYLRDHDEFLGEEVLPLKDPAPRKPARTARKPRKVVAEPMPRPVESATTLQPLVVFLITASLITAAAFGYKHFSQAIADAKDENAPAAEAPGFVEAPNIVHSRPAPTKPVTVETAKPPVVAATIVGEDGDLPPISRALPITPDGTPITFDAPPPRAVIVEE